MRDLIVKDLVRRWRSPAATLVMLLFPVVMSLMIGSISGGGGGDGPDFPTIRVLLVDQDDDLLGGLLANMGGNTDTEESLDLDVVTLDEGTRLMENGEASAMLVLPAGTTDALFAGEEVVFRLVRNPAESIKPEIVEQGLLLVATVLDLAVKVFGEEMREIRALNEQTEMPEVAQITTLSGKIFERIRDMERFVLPPSVKISNVTEDGDESSGPGFNVFGYVLVMISVMAVLFVASRSVMDLFEEEKTGMLHRQAASPLSMSTVVDAKLLFGVLFSVLAMGILLVFAFALRWISGPVDLLGVTVHTIVFAGAACGLMTVAFALARTEKQGGILTWIVIMVMSVLGGSMLPVQNMPDAMQQVARFTVNYWAIEGFIDLLVRKESFAEMMGRTAVLAALAVVTIGVGKVAATRRFREMST